MFYSSLVKMLDEIGELRVLEGEFSEVGGDSFFEDISSEQV